MKNIIYQQKSDDCVTACLSSITGIPYEECFYFDDAENKSTEEFFVEYDEWLSKHGLMKIVIMLPSKLKHVTELNLKLSKGVHYCIGELAYDDDRDYTHAVVAKIEVYDDGYDISVAHDPIVPEIAVNYVELTKDDMIGLEFIVKCP